MRASGGGFAAGRARYLLRDFRIVSAGPPGPARFIKFAFRIFFYFYNFIRLFSLFSNSLEYLTFSFSKDLAISFLLV